MKKISFGISLLIIPLSNPVVQLSLFSISEDLLCERIHVFSNENSTNYNNRQASKGKADDSTAHPNARSGGNDRLNPQI